MLTVTGYKNMSMTGLSGQDKSMLAFMRGRGFARTAGLLTVCFFSFVFYLSPAGQAVAQEVEREEQREARLERLYERTPDAKLAHRLQKLKNTVEKLPQKIEERQDAQGVFEAIMAYIFLNQKTLEDREVAELTELKADIESAYQEAATGLNLTQAFVEERVANDKLPAVALERQKAAREQIEARYEELNNLLNTVITAENADAQHNAVTQLNEFLEQQQFQPTHTPENPDRLPFGTANDKVREPKTTRRDLQAALDLNPYQQMPQLASLGNPAAVLSGMAALGAPVSADTAPTLDAPLTEDIQTLAEELNNNPTEIYSWVHNNIRYIPSHGSIQGAQLTLETETGNAVDTASLLIALLRAAGIPARYAYGTVEVPVDKVMNWVGGVDTPQAAQNLLGQGGIPNTAIIEGGVISKIRFEHTWVEAWVDFEPSRGVKNIQGDHWIPMDPSFKQYEFTDGMNLEDNVPFDAQGLVDEINANATVNETEGWVQNVPQSALEDQLADFQQQIENYITTQNPDATVGEVLGLQEVDIIPPQPLASGLPYHRIVTQDTFSEVPGSLRHKFHYQLATQTHGYVGSPLITIEEPTVALAGKKLSLSFAPATPEDQAIIEGYIPEPDPDTGEIDPSQLPTTLPGYLIHLTAEFSIDGEMVASGAAGTMGTELHETLKLWSPKERWQRPAINHPIAGEYRAIGLDLQGASPEHAARLQANVESTQAKLESGDEAQLATLTKSDVVGDLLYATIFSYFALNDVQDEIQAQSSDVVTYRLPSYGIFSTQLTPRYWFGVPRNTDFGGLGMDVDALTYQTTAKDNSHETRLNYMRAAGARGSAMEHLVPEQMFSTETQQAQGISAVKALGIASAEGQRVWTIDQNNLDLALSEISLHADTESEIRNSVLAGKVVTAHEMPIDFHGWVGSGYIILDPATGAGAYKIGGGTNGSFIGPGNIIDFISSLLKEFGELGKYLGRLLGRIKKIFDFLVSSNKCGIKFSLLKFFSVLSFTVGMTFLLLPYFAILGLFAAALLVTILRILVVEILLSTYFASKFTCKKP